MGHIKIIDVGAMMDDGSGQPDYGALLKYNGVRVVGFEPSSVECDRLNRMITDDRHEYLPCFVGDGTEREFNVCDYNATSSFFKPNMALLGKFQNLAELCRVVRTPKVQTKRLDDLKEVEGADYMKTDVQGAEIDVFKGAKALLSDLMVIHTEVAFVPLYENQPLFAEIDQYLRKAGFIFHKFHSIAGRAFKPMVVNNDVNHPMSQSLWADAIYVKSFLNYDNIQPEKLLKLAVIMHEVYASFDLAHHALQNYDRQTGASFASSYIAGLCQR